LGLNRNTSPSKEREVTLLMEKYLNDCLKKAISNINFCDRLSYHFGMVLYDNLTDIKYMSYNILEGEYMGDFVFIPDSNNKFFFGNYMKGEIHLQNSK
jgi:hypothetical protein